MSRTFRHRSWGVSLIEVLVSLVILSLGVLAVVALQLVAKRNNADAGQRTIAAQLTYDIVERMRSNSTANALRSYLTGTTYVGRGSMGAEPTPNCKDPNVCTEQQLAVHDLWEWERAIDGEAERLSGGTTGIGGLVQPTACITGPVAGGDGLYTITIVWRSNVEMPDNTDPDAPTCGRDPQASGPSLYSKDSNNRNEFRRTMSTQVYITARRRAAS